MVTIKRTDENIELESIISINLIKTFEFESDIATVELYDGEEISDINKSETIKIYDNEDNILFSGNIIKYNTTDTPAKLKIRGKLNKLKEYETSGRVFYREPVGEIIEKLITEDITDKGTSIVYRGDDLNNVDSDFPEFELTDFKEITEQRVGNNTLFCGLPPKTDGEFTVTISDLNIDEDEFKKLFIDLIINNQGGNFDLKVEYQYNDKNYVWKIDRLDTVDNRVTLELNAEKATISGSSLNENNTLQITVDTNGKTQEGRALAIDSISFQVYDIIDRDIDLTLNTDNLNSLSDLTTRKFTNNLYVSIESLINSIDYTIITDDDVLNVVEKNGDDTDKTINDKMLIVDDDIDFDTDEIINQVIVEGDNDIKVTYTNNSSVKFYGITNTKRIRDRSINTRTDAKRLAQQKTEDKGFTDTKITYEIADSSLYDKLNIGESISVDLKEIIGTFTIKKIELTENLTTKITLKK